LACPSKKVDYLEQQLYIRGDEMAAATKKVDYLEQQLNIRGG
jgi:hypothetical protein